MVEWATYPLYPAVRLVTVHCLPQSTASTSSSPSSPIKVITWRALVPQETDLAYRLQKLPAQLLPERFVAVLQSENREGRAAQERGDWNTAMAKFETCRTMISEDLRKLVPMHVEEQDFDLLLAWADLPLAELYQSLGSSDSVMLEKAMDVRKEVLHCVTCIFGSSFWPRANNPLPTNNGIGSSLGDMLVQVCATYYYTAQYEWGRAVNNEPARIETVQKFANFVGCSDDEAESQLCLLLSVDYLYLGRFEVSLEWIQEADRHWPQISPGVDEYRDIQLLMKVEEFAEAIKTLLEPQDSELGGPRTQISPGVYEYRGILLDELLMKVEEFAEAIKTPLEPQDSELGPRTQISPGVDEYRGILLDELLMKVEEFAEAITTPLEPQDSELGGPRTQISPGVDEYRGILLDESLKVEEFAEAIMTLHEPQDSELGPRTQISPGVDEYRVILRLSEAELMMKVEEFTEAIKTLQEPQDSELGPRIKHVLEGSERDSLQFPCGLIPQSHPMLKATPCPLGSSLGLVREGDIPLRNELRKLPVLQSGVLEILVAQGETAREDRDWEAAAYYYERMRELLKLTARVVEKQTYDWLLSWCDLTLAHFYHYHTRRFEKALMIWVDLLCSASHQMGSAHECLLHGYYFNLAAVLFEGFGEVLIQPYHVLDGNKACGTDRYTSERHSCFWLYFGHHRVCNYETALHWLRESKRLKEEHLQLCSTVACPEMTCSDDDYVCCDYDYLRCEADVLMKLRKFEEAITVLEKLLRTRHVQQGSRLLARQASGWLHRCRDSMGILAESMTNRMETPLFETSSAVDNEHGNGTAEKLPSTFGCIRVLDGQIMLAQSQVGLEHHLHQLPVPLHVAFRWHGNRGSSFLKLHQWEAAIFEFEWCREILKIIRGVQASEVEQVKACDWLMVWASVPLADIYEFRKNQIKKALDLWAEIAEIILAVNRQCEASGDVAIVESAVSLLFVGRYHYSVSEYKEYPAVKDEVVRTFALIFRGEKEYWVSEQRLLMYLYKSFVKVGKYEAALPFIRQVKQVVDQQFSGQGLHHMDVLFGHVLAESECLYWLQRPDDAAKVLRDYLKSFSNSDVNAKELPEKVLRTKKVAEDYAQFFEVMNDKLGGVSFMEMLKYFHNREFESEIWQLRMKSLEFAKNGELLEAVECYENRCVELIDKTRNEGLEGALDCKLNAWDYFCLGQLRTALIAETRGSCSYEQIKAYLQDVNFVRTVQYYEKAAELLSPNFDAYWKVSAQWNTSMALLYEEIDEPYVRRLLNHYAECLKESVSLFSDMHCTRDRVDLVVLWEQSYRDIVSGNYTGGPLPVQDAINEIQTFLKLDIPVEKYGEKAVSQYLSYLYTMGSSSYTEGWWVGILEFENILFKVLQFHHYRRVLCFVCLQGRGEDFQKQIETSTWNAFRYAEAERAQVMLYQQLVASNKLYCSQQWRHDAPNVDTVEDLRELCAIVLKGRSGPSVYVQYSPLDEAEEFFIYVIDQDGKLNMIHGGDPEEGTRKPEREGGTRSIAVKKPLSLEKRLNKLFQYLEKGDFGNYNGDSMMKDLMFLHGLLIKPIAHILEKMKPDDNLILCPNELFTKVPFAALRDFESSQKYLIELHTISLVPSLRVLHSCSERLEQLQRSSSYTGYARSIIALGDPNYCPTCTRNFKPLEGTRDEVNHIATLFGDAAVTKLLGEQATKEQLLQAAKASDDSNCFGQAIVHVGAHGTIDERHNRKTVRLHLTCDDPASSANIGVPSLTDDTSLSREESTSKALGKRHRVESDDEDWTDSDDEESGLQINMSISKTSDMQSMFKKCASFQETSEGASSSRSRGKIRRNAGVTQQGVASHALKVEDLSSFEWRVQLVVLSTCLSARGRITTEGVLSFARAFMIAGAACVVASQWKVADDATVALMKVFYEELHQGKNVASALRSSMLTHMSTHRDSVGQWAPLNVWGVSSLCLPEDLLDPHRSRAHPMSGSPLQADLASGEGNEL